jgi:exonuclease SbcC
MPSYQDLAESYKRLQGVLEGLLHEQSPELAVFQDDDYPLLVLVTSSDSVGFAVINGTPDASFARAYDSFKKLYREMHASWKDRNLSFVICRSETKPASDAFFGSLETDVYFCRKYVIDLPQSMDELQRELLRLPFLPFQEGRAGVLVRPPSAQTLLQDLNISAMLARQIVVPQEYSAARIVDQLLAEKDVLPPIQFGPEPVMRQQVQPVKRMRVRKVEIEAFRAYRKRQIFDVDADVVILYGPNGLGKTSFFDALDYVCTGRIGRLCRQRINQRSFIEFARHLDSSPLDGFISAHLTQGTSDYSVIRSLAEWGTAVIDGEAHDRASTLQFLTSAQWEPKKARIENLERLFRATHLFSQTDQELLVEFAENSSLAPDLVSRMLALDDYASGLAKAEAVLVNLEKRISQNHQLIVTLKEEVSQLNSRIRSLPQLHETVEDGKHFSKLAIELNKELRLFIGLKADEAQPTAASAREWRAMVESTLKDAEDRLRKLQMTESGFVQFDKSRNALRETVAEISTLEKLLKARTDERERQKEASDKLSHSLEQDREVLAHAKSRLRDLEEFGLIQEVYQKTDGSFQQWRQELNRVVGEIEMTTAQLQPLFLTIENLRAQIAKYNDTIHSHSRKIKALLKIQNGIPSWQQNRAIMTKLQKAIAEVQSAIQSDNARIDVLKTGLTKKEKELAACEQKYEELSADQDELTRLLDELEMHIKNGICPTCGVDHKSKMALIQRMHGQKQARPVFVDEFAKRCAELRNVLKQDKTSLATITREQSSKINELRDRKNELSEVRELLVYFERSADEFGLSMDEDPTGTVARKVAQEKHGLELSLAALTQHESKLAETTKRMKALEQKSAELEVTRKRVMATLAPIEKQVVDLRSKADDLGLSLEMASQDIVAEITKAVAHDAMAIKRVAELTPQMEGLTKALSVLHAQISQAKDKIIILRQDKARLEEEIRQFVESAASVLDRDALSLEAIGEQRRITTERVDQLHALQRRCSTLELALDAAQRNAMRAELEARAQSLTNNERVLEKETAEMSTVKKWFERVRDTLDKQSSHAVANHVEALGPLTTLIQKRLRAVYGFGDIILSAKGNEIRVAVGWKSKLVKPADYFSDSQKQILMLSLFLAGRLTQTWSGFAPILLDDPVTHFDDLNAFGFVELIRGFVSTDPGKRQFFISTCEQRLFDLMRKKFSRLEGGARFYRFESIGRDGPVVHSLGED